MITRRQLLRASTMMAGACAVKQAPAWAPSSTGAAPNYFCNYFCDYFCTWHSQYHLAGERLHASDMSKMMGSDGAKLARAELTEANLLEPGGMAERFYPSLRRNLIFVLDDGWDVPPDGDLSFVGSQEIDRQRFPSLEGGPQQRLQQLNRAFQDRGWRSAGLWIAAQMAPAVLERDRAAGKDVDSEIYQRAYWQERLDWSRAAGILYWKVDWGKKAGDVWFREQLSMLAEQADAAPAIEATLPCGPLNQPLVPSAPGGVVGRADPEWVRRSLPLLQLPGTFRVYDSLPYLSAATLLDRIAALLAAGKGLPAARAILNSEDEVYLGAALGCCVGIMRSAVASPGGAADAQDQDPRHLARRLTEVQRAVRWHEIAPPMPVGACPVAVDETILWDSWSFSPGQTWFSAVIGKTVRQGAPARIARGLSLPAVKAQGDPPFVVAARHPNGSLAVATVGRMSPEGWSTPLADVALEGSSLRGKIGVFGLYRSLSIRFDQSLRGRTVVARDLADGRSIKITHGLAIQGSSFRLEGSLIDEIAASAAAKADGSEPGIVLEVV